jgi:hypothetical protein
LACNNDNNDDNDKDNDQGGFEEEEKYVQIYYSQNEKTIETISRLKTRIETRNELLNIKSGLLFTEIFIFLFHLIIIIVPKVAVVVYLYIKKIDVLSVSYSNEIIKFNQQQQENSTVIYSDLFQPSSQFNWCYNQINYLLLFLFIYSIASSILRLFNEIFFFINYKLALVNRFLNNSRESEIMLNNDYEVCKERLFRRKMQEIMDKKDENIYGDYATLLRGSTSNNNHYEQILPLPNSTFNIYG